MAQATVTSKGQVTIPKEVRDRLGLRAGDKIEFVEGADGFQLKKRLDENPFVKWRGYLTHLKGRTTDEIMEELRAANDHSG